MSEQKIQPHNVTKPIQLLAAWLVGLILINGSFLGAAKVITAPDWAAGLLVIAAVINVPVFLILIFFLQTKFRAELQEDTYYSKHLDKITGARKEKAPKNDDFINTLKEIQESSHDQFEQISKNLEDVSKSLSEVNSTSFDTQSVIEKLSKTKESIEYIEREKYKRSIKIAINEKIPSYHDITKKLVQSGFSINYIFGRKKPESLTISYLSDIKKEYLAEIYMILEPYGFNRIDYAGSRSSPDKSDIYIGSYVDEFPDAEPSVVIDGDIKKALLDPDASLEQLNKCIVLSRA